MLCTKSPMVKDQLDTWQDAISGAAPMGEELQVEAGRRLGGGATRVRQTWGLSETCGSITIVPLQDAHKAPQGSVGALAPSCYARIVDDNERDVKPGEAGEIWVKGPIVTKGYWRNEKANKDSYRGGWFCTGDIGMVKNGWFYIVDRKKVGIKSQNGQLTTH